MLICTAIFIISSRLSDYSIFANSFFVMRLTLLADMMTQWNTHHESQYQFKLVWHHMISWSKLAIKIDKKNQDDQYWQEKSSWSILIITWSCDQNLWSRLTTWLHWELTQFRMLLRKYSFNLSKNVYNFWLKFLILFFLFLYNVLYFMKIT